MEVTTEGRPRVGAVRTQASAPKAKTFRVKICTELAQGVWGPGGSGAVGLCGRRNQVKLITNSVLLKAEAGRATVNGSCPSSVPHDIPFSDSAWWKGR